MPAVTFPYPELEPLQVPDENFAGLFERRQVETPAEPAVVVKNSLESPHGTGLWELASPGVRVLILVDDVSRPTRADLVLPVLLESLVGAGVDQSDIKFLMALGTHRAMTPGEIETKLGSQVYRGFEASNHEWLNPSALASAGTTGSGIEIHINTALKEADLVIGVGHIAPHAAAGFGGGGKIVLPGVCGQKTTMQMHSLARSIGTRKLKGTIDNPVRQEIDAVAIQAGLRFIVNVVQDQLNRIIDCYSGEPVAAHRAGAVRALEVHGTPIAGPFDIVIIDSHPADIDLWQAGKALGAAAVVVRPEGAIILVTPCPDGVSPEHTIWLELAHLDDETVQKMIDTDAVEDKVGASAVMGMRSYTLRFNIIVVSPGISAEDKRRLGLGHASTVAEALEKALAGCGSKASVAVLRHGGEILPIPVEQQQ